HLARLSRIRRCAITSALLSALVLVPAVVVAQAPSTTHFQVLHAFNGGNGALATSGVILDSKGNMYGTTVIGGDLDCSDNPGSGCGLVYELSPTGEEKILHKFKGQDGFAPVWVGDLARDSQGSLYGVTWEGGNNSCACGNIFKIDTTGHETTLHSFTGTNNGDGARPYGGVILDGNGNLYGTTFNGGDNSCNPGYGCGTVFRFDLKTSKEKILYSFGGSSEDGQNPYGSLVEDAAGNLYGTTSNGPGSGCGGGGCGTVFMVDKKNHETVLYAFTGVDGDGATPLPALVLDKKGNLYGDTSYGGNNSDSGIVFKLTKTSKTWQETILHTFSGSDGAQPDGAVVFDTAGNLYGTTVAGGSFGYGTVYKLTPKGNRWAVTVLHNFKDGKDGAVPFTGGGLAIDSTGSLYGTAAYGGDLKCQISGQDPGCGVVFKITQ
ncbi:MAG TPA: choice-of-anchor tandem repeat GloVer-containing protein, partial [Terriglobales bacterium]|nr:choice-of-anchor tandem repeat GloVer-containing protein [Terriglobales bacterium]